MNRRSFLKKSTSGFIGSLFAVGTGNSFGLDEKEEMRIRWAFLSDTHIQAVDDSNNPPEGHYYYNPHENLRTVITEVLRASPEGAVITGDLARLTGEPGDYANLRRLLEPAIEKMPIYMALGNHDDRDNYLEAFSNVLGENQPVQDKHVIVVNAPPVRFILLDSLFYVDGSAGLLGRDQRRWLEQYLKETDNTPTILFVHHTLGDSDGSLLDVPRLFRMIEPVRKVKAIVYGHSHRYGYSEFEGIHLINLPATGYSFNVDEPVGWVEAQITAEGGDFTLRVVDGNREKDGSVKKLKWRI